MFTHGFTSALSQYSGNLTRIVIPLCLILDPVSNIIPPSCNREIYAYSSP